MAHSPILIWVHGLRTEKLSKTNGDASEEILLLKQFFPIQVLKISGFLGVMGIRLNLISGYGKSKGPLDKSD